MSSAGSRAFPVLVMGCDEKSCDRFMKMFDEAEGKDREDGEKGGDAGRQRMRGGLLVRTIRSKRLDVTFKLTLAKNMMSRLETNTTLPRNTFALAKHRDVVALVLYDLSSEVSMARAIEFYPKCVETAMYMWETRWKKTYRAKAVMGEGYRVRPPIQIAVAGLRDASSNEDISASHIRETFMKRCEKADFSLCSELKKSEAYLCDPLVVLLDAAVDARERRDGLVALLEDVHEFGFRLDGVDGRVKKEKAKSRASTRRPETSAGSSAKRSSGDGEGNTCCVLS